MGGPLIILFLFYTVALQLGKQPHWKDSLRSIMDAATGQQQWKLYCMFGLMWVNWSLETIKWKIALRPVQPIHFLLAFKAILAGTCIASFTPNRVGEYLGRMLFVNPENKMRSVAPSILCSRSQMLFTLIAGSGGLYLFSTVPYHFEAKWMTPLLLKSAMMGTIGMTVVFGLVYFRFDPMVQRINQWFKTKKNRITLPLNFSMPVLSGLLFISMIRYGVFVLQYFLLFSAFGIPLMIIQVFTGLSVMFVLMAIIPTLTFLTDLGFRWVVGIQIFQIFTLNTAGILAVSLGIWLINLIIPALIGSLLILRIKLFSNR